VAARGVRTGLAVGPVRISFQRVPRVPDDAPPARLRSHGVLPVALVSEDIAFVPVGDEEGVWLGLEGRNDLPCAVRVLIQSATLEDAVTGRPPSNRLTDDPQNYVVVPLQHWLEGATVDGTCARQFVRIAWTPKQAAVQVFSFLAAPLREGFQPASGRTRENGPPCRLPEFVEQDLWPDPYGVGAWNESAVARMQVRVVSGEEYLHATGSTAPPALDPGSAYGGWRLP
jgi:hypothetical protein